MIRDSRVQLLPGADPEGASEPAGTPCLKRLDFGIKRRDVLAAPVVGEMLEPQLLEHGCAIFGRALLAVKRDDTPGDQVVAGIEPLHGVGRCLAWNEPRRRVAGRARIAGDARKRSSEGRRNKRMRLTSQVLPV